MSLESDALLGNGPSANRTTPEDVFAQFDTDGSGALSLQEVRAALTKLSLPVDERDERLFNALDTDGNVLLVYSSPVPPATLQRLFLTCDFHNYYPPCSPRPFHNYMTLPRRGYTEPASWSMGMLCPCIDFSELSWWLQNDKDEIDEDAAPEEANPLIDQWEESDEAPPPISAEMRRVLQEAFARSQRASQIHGASQSRAEGMNVDAGTFAERVPTSTLAPTPTRQRTAGETAGAEGITPPTEGRRASARGGCSGNGKSLDQVHSKVDCHMPARIMRATRAHNKDYVHEQGLRTGQRPDVRHAHAKVDDHMPGCFMRATKGQARSVDLELDLKMIQLSQSRRGRDETSRSTSSPSSHHPHHHHTI